MIFDITMWNWRLNRKLRQLMPAPLRWDSRHIGCLIVWDRPSDSQPHFRSVTRQSAHFDWPDLVAHLCGHRCSERDFAIWISNHRRINESKTPWLHSVSRSSIKRRIINLVRAFFRPYVCCCQDKKIKMNISAGEKMWCSNNQSLRITSRDYHHLLIVLSMVEIKHYLIFKLYYSAINLC